MAENHHAFEQDGKAPGFQGRLASFAGPFIRSMRQRRRAIGQRACYQRIKRGLLWRFHVSNHVAGDREKTRRNASNDLLRARFMMRAECDRSLFARARRGRRKSSDRECVHMRYYVTA